MLSFRWVLGDMTDNSPGEILALLADLANADEEHVDVGSGKGDFGVGILVDRWIYTSDLGRLFGGRPVAFPGGDIMKAVRGVVLSAFPGCDTRGCQGRWGAGPVVMTRPSRLRARRGESDATGSAGRSSGADRVERGRFRRPPAPPRLRVPHGGTASRMS